MPEVSEGVTAVDVADVRVSVGDTIAADAVVCEVETDKAVAEINCPHAGTVRAVHVSAGQKIPIGALLLDIETGATVSGGGIGVPTTQTGLPTAGTGNGSQPATQSAAARASASSPAVRGESPLATTVNRSPSSSHDGRPPAAAGPATRRLARKLGVDLYQVTGTARSGRITIEDVQTYVRTRLASSPPAVEGSVSTGIVAAAPLPDFSKFGPVEKEPLNKIFRTAAANLHAAWITIPHVTQHNLADITELEAARKRYVDTNPKSPKITMTAIMIKAVVGALKTFPKVNSSIDLESGELVLKKYYHIGVAVDTPNGLVVPVIRNCDQKNVLQVAAELTELADRARDRKLKAEEMQGASFTITNLGGIGGTSFTPIVNYPEVAILGMSRGQKVLQMDDGIIVERLMLPLSLSYDHRAINGADAARFIVKLSGSLTRDFELF
ncbi:MAG: 2-oxo acid dehydrogenase subunit E2 [Planctomycetaceae bacterium]|nr:2-oxo acid dehydrogenase subunit E2 [Planctomycetaceae bacterium]